MTTASASSSHSSPASSKTQRVVHRTARCAPGALLARHYGASANGSMHKKAQCWYEQPEPKPRKEKFRGSRQYRTEGQSGIVGEGASATAPGVSTGSPDAACVATGS